MSFDIRTAVGPLEVHLQNLKSLRSLRHLSAFEAEGFEVFEICHFFREMAQKDTFSMSAKSAKNRRGRKMYEKNAPLETDLLLKVQHDQVDPQFSKSRMIYQHTTS